MLNVHKLVFLRFFSI